MERGFILQKELFKNLPIVKNELDTTNWSNKKIEREIIGLSKD